MANKTYPNLKGNILIETAPSTGKYTSMYSSNTKNDQLELDVSNILNNTSVPSGYVMMYWNTNNKIPAGWKKCPDIPNGYFVMASSTKSNQKVKAGNDTGTLPYHTHTISFSEAGKHRHSGNIGATRSSEAPNHTHTQETEPSKYMRRIDRCNASWGGWRRGFKNFNGSAGSNRQSSQQTDHNHKVYGATWNTKGSGNHSHKITLKNTGSNSTYDNRPPYQTLIYIQKI